MKRIISLCITFVLILGFGFLNPQLLFAQEPVLENYSITHGGDPETTPSGIKANLFDKFFGGGTAKARVAFNTRDNSSHLSLIPCADRQGHTDWLLACHIPKNNGSILTA